MRRVLILLAVLLMLPACAAPAEATEEESPAPPLQKAPEQPATAEPSPEEEVPVEEVPSEDHVLLTLEAPLADGRTLTLEAVGKRLDEYSAGVREVRVYDGDALIQTVQAREGIVSEGVEDSDYTDCWSTEDCMDELDLNFDGDTDFGLFAGRCNNMIPYYYWTWDREAGQYQFACILQGAEAHPESGETTAEYKSGSAGSQWVTEYYWPDGNGSLYLHRVERLVRDFQPDSGYLDVEREGAREVWLPREGDFLRPRPAEWSVEADLVLASREVPVYEGNGDGTVSYFTELWEFWDGEPQLVERKEYIP